MTLLQPQLEYRFRLGTAKTLAANQINHLISSQTEKVILNYVSNTIEIWIRQPLSSEMHILVNSMAKNPLKELTVEGFHDSETDYTHKIILNGCTMTHHQVRYSYTGGDPCRHYIVFEYEDISFDS